MKTKSVKLVLTSDAKKLAKTWFDAARWTYNQCVEAVQSKAASPTESDLRAYCVTHTSPKVARNPWIKEVPNAIRNNAMCDLVNARRTCLKVGKPFTMKFRTKKDRQQTIAIDSRDWGRKSGHYAALRKGVHGTEPIPDEMPSEAKLCRDRRGDYYLRWAVPLDVRSEEKAPKADLHGTIALDPGVRTFMTGYDADGAIIEWGAGDMGRLVRLCRSYDRLQSAWTNVKSRKRRRMKIAGLRVQAKIHNLVKELHQRCASWLCSRYRAILLPVFETQRMIQRGRRRLNSKTARAMLTWSHYSFRQHIVHKAREFPWAQVVLVTEEYTSKTCGNCGHLHTKLGGAKNFKCPRCSIEADRDANAARNILLKYLTEMNASPV